jgi:hypothetical protein
MSSDPSDPFKDSEAPDEWISCPVSTPDPQDAETERPPASDVAKDLCGAIDHALLYLPQNPTKARWILEQMRVRSRSVLPVQHVLKTDPIPFAQIWLGFKKFEVRVFDRDFQLGDELWLQEHDRENGYTGVRIRATITSMVRPGEYGLDGNVGVLGIEVLEKCPACTNGSGS